ncbi:uncharacterized protein LOC119176242 isoform X3 [Rhipicephalus microplus]|uniref:uncharacterized protein LOC119176242 isoform X3 n=1 Tax=Rhipicephalus microplus TaxID=6941 RepID=UPI003F6BDC43
MHDSLIWNDCDLLGRAQNCLTAGCKVTFSVPQSHGSSSPCLWLAVRCSQHTCRPSHGALLWCSVQDTAYPSCKTLIPTIMARFFCHAPRPSIR